MMIRRVGITFALVSACLLLGSWRQNIGLFSVSAGTTSGGGGGDPCTSIAIGSPCSGTTALNLGTFNGAKYMVTPSGCTDSATPTCAGGTDTVKKFWEGDPGATTSDVDILSMPNTVAIGEESVQFGDAAIAGMLGSGVVSSNSAAHYCDSMTYGGYSDWYLPSKTEMAYLYCKSQSPTSGHNTSFPEEDPNCVNYGGKTSEITGYQNEQYWTSTEFTYNEAFRQYVGNGTQQGSFKNTQYAVRCIRRYDTTLGSSAPNLVQLNLLSYAAGTLHTITTPKETTAGNVVIIAASGRASTHTVNSITGCGATFTQRARIGVTNCEAEIWTGVCTSAATSFTITSNANLLRAFQITEWQNLTGGLDVADAGTNQNSFTNSTAGVTTTRANTVIIAAGSMDKQASMGSGAPTNGFFNGGVVVGGGGGNQQGAFYAYKPLNATGTHSTSYALSGTGSPNSCFISAAIY